MNIQDLLGAVVQSGMSQSSTGRVATSLAGGGLLDSLAGMLGGASGSGTQGGGALGGVLGNLGGMLGGASGKSSQSGGILGNILAEAGKAVGGTQNLALGGLGALAGSLLGGGKKSVGGALGGGVMALLGVMAFQALKARAGQTAKVPLGLAVPQSKAQEAELERNTQLVLRAMLNAAKSDGQIDEGEIRRILGKVEENGVDQQARDFLVAEMKKPMETEILIAAGKGKPELAAQLYSASLLAIEVDTPAEREYLEKLASGMRLDPEVTSRIHQIVGLQQA
jgi:uncharacterized membrane protein YebE (DUF533 family)